MMMMKMPQTVTNLYLSQTRELFHCHVKIKIPLGYDESILDACFTLMEEIDVKFNSYQRASFFDRINTNAGNWTEVDDTTVFLLKQLGKVSVCTDGRYDITSMPLIRLWGFYMNRVEEIPSDEAIEDVLKKVDYKKIEINGNKVKIEAGQEIITGSFIKSYAVDQVIALLRKHGITDALINAGGSTFATLNNTEHKSWYVNLPDPAIVNKKLARIPLSSQFFSMSACMSNYLEIKGKKYGHILNAETGWPEENLQVGVIADSAFEADVLSTALFSTPASQVQETVKKLMEKFRFFIYHIDQNGEVYDSGFHLNTMKL